MRILVLAVIAALSPMCLALDARAEDSCAYSLVRFQSGQGERLAMIPRLELIPADLASEPIVDITALVESEGKILLSQALENAFLDSDRQRFLAEKACELARNRVDFLVNNSARLVRVAAANARLPIPTSRVLIGGTAARVPNGAKVLLRERLAPGQVLTAANLNEVAAGLVIENRFIPIEFLNSPLNSAYIADLIAILEGARAAGLERGDFVERR